MRFFPWYTDLESRRLVIRYQEGSGTTTTPATSWGNSGIVDVPALYTRPWELCTGQASDDMNKIDYELLGCNILCHQYRAGNNKPLFSPSMILYNAYMHSYDMAVEFFSHTSPIAGRASPSDRVAIWQLRIGGEILQYLCHPVQGGYKGQLV